MTAGPHVADEPSGADAAMVSVILPVYNEAGFIERTVASLLGQELDPGADLEILVIDGQSTDGSREIVQRLAHRDRRVRVLSNPHQTTPYAFNIGLRAARGAYVCILGAHCVYARDYIAVCLREMDVHDAVGCSGRILTRPASASLSALLTCWALRHPFGVSGSSVRTQAEGYADNIPFPVFRKAALLQLGGYDETMTRNQDNDMNHRLRRAGHKLYCTWKTSCEYWARSDLKGLMGYARSNGFWCGISARTSPLSLGVRHYMPFVFLVGTLLGLLLPLAWRVQGPLAVLSVLPLALHLLTGHVAALGLAVQERSWRPLLLPWIFLAFHLSYGFAFARGLLSFVGPRALHRA